MLDDKFQQPKTTGDVRWWPSQSINLWWCRMPFYETFFRPVMYWDVRWCLVMSVYISSVWRCNAVMYDMRWCSLDKDVTGVMYIRDTDRLISWRSSEGQVSNTSWLMSIENLVKFALNIRALYQSYYSRGNGMININFNIINILFLFWCRVRK